MFVSDLIVGVVLAIVLLILIYFVILFFVKRQKRVSTEEANRILVESLKCIIKAFSDNSVSEVSYPVFIGWNGYDFKPILINQAFDRLSKYWEICFFDTVFINHPNVVVYQFRVQVPIHKELKPRRLEYLAQAIAEEALTMHLRSWKCYVPVDKFIATSLKEDILKIAIAKNNSGFEDIAKLRKH